jgi:hypothetical protein
VSSFFHELLPSNQDIAPPLRSVRPVPRWACAGSATSPPAASRNHNAMSRTLVGDSHGFPSCAPIPGNRGRRREAREGGAKIPSRSTSGRERPESARPVTLRTRFGSGDNGASPTSDGR